MVEHSSDGQWSSDGWGEKIVEEDKDERAADAYIRYESKLDAYRFLQGKFANYHAKKDFHDLPDGLFGQRKY